MRAAVVLTLVITGVVVVVRGVGLADVASASAAEVRLRREVADAGSSDVSDGCSGRDDDDDDVASELDVV